MQSAEETMAEAGWRDDEEEGAAVAVKRLGVGEPVVSEADETIAEGGLVGGGKFAEEGFREEVEGVVTEGSEDGLEGFVSKVAGSPFVGFGKGREEGAGDNILGLGGKGLEMVAEECVDE